MIKLVSPPRPRPQLGDAINSILEQIQIRCTVMEDIAFPANTERIISCDEPIFLFVCSGEIDLISSDDKLTQVGSGDLVFIHRGTEVTIRPTYPRNPPNYSGHFPSSDQPVMLTGKLQFACWKLPPMLTGMPDVIVYRVHAELENVTNIWLKQTLLLWQERSDGMLTMINHLLTMVYLNEIRQKIKVPGFQPAGWWKAINDPDIGPVLNLMMQEPEKHWTVERLAGAGFLSRSSFARKFRELMDTTPIETLTEIRMARASEMLKKNYSIKDVVTQVGYDSLSAFSVAFRRWAGESPRQYRSRQNYISPPSSEPEIEIEGDI
jgi:AraC-like DNA-binding protein